MLAVVADLPLDASFPESVGLGDFDLDASLAGKAVDGITGEGRFHPDGVEGNNSVPGWESVFHCHMIKKSTTTRSCCCLIF